MARTEGEFPNSHIRRAQQRFRLLCESPKGEGREGLCPKGPPVLDYRKCSEMFAFLRKKGRKTVEMAGTLRQ